MTIPTIFGRWLSVHLLASRTVSPLQRFHLLGEVQEDPTCNRETKTGDAPVKYSPFQNFAFTEQFYETARSSLGTNCKHKTQKIKLIFLTFSLYFQSKLRERVFLVYKSESNT